MRKKMFTRASALVMALITACAALPVILGALTATTVFVLLQRRKQKKEKQD